SENVIENDSGDFEPPICCRGLRCEKMQHGYTQIIFLKKEKEESHRSKECACDYRQNCVRRTHKCQPAIRQCDRIVAVQRV
ncbi:MAG: hypothetical protein ACRD3B_01670, partial [Candidatus Sulfotelmatobacter sp.]